MINAVRYWFKNPINFAEKQPSSSTLPEVMEFCIYDDETLEQFKLVFDPIERGK